MELPSEVGFFLTGAGGLAVLNAIISALKDRGVARGKREDEKGLMWLSRVMWKHDSGIQRNKVEELGGDPGPMPDDPWDDRKKS